MSGVLSNLSDLCASPGGNNRPGVWHRRAPANHSGRGGAARHRLPRAPQNENRTGKEKDLEIIGDLVPWQKVSLFFCHGIHGILAHQTYSNLHVRHVYTILPAETLQGSATSRHSQEFVSSAKSCRQKGSFHINILVGTPPRNSHTTRYSNTLMNEI